MKEIELRQRADDSWMIERVGDSLILEVIPLGKLSKEQATLETVRRFPGHTIRIWDKEVLKAISSGQAKLFHGNNV
jgi:hypothetical protein